MQLTLQTGSGGRSSTRAGASNCAKTALIAGIFLAGAGLVAAGPTTTMALPPVQHHDVKLVDQYVNPIDPATVFTLAGQNITNIQTAIANVPLDDKLTDLFTAYSDRLSDAFEASANAYDELVTQFPITLQTSLDFLADGEFVEAYIELNSFGLFGAEDLAAPIYALVNGRGGVPEGILNDLAQQTYQGLNALFTRGTVNGLALALSGPSITANFEAALIADNIEDAISTGDYEEAFQHLLDAPSQILGAYLNGAAFDFTPDVEDPLRNFPGLLSPQGPFQFLFATLPTRFSDAITLPTTAAAAASADAAEVADTGDWSALFGGDWSALFDASNWTALFDGSALAESVTSAIDPGAVSDELTSLVTSIF